MKEVVIGSTGFIGRALLERLGPAAEGTSRRPGGGPGDQTFDLLDPLVDLPFADVFYLCAGANGAKRCEGNQEAFRVNVDAPIAIARAESDAFVVWISSMSVEWLDGAYQRQKLAAESVLRTLPNVGIVRAGRVTRDNLPELCDELIRVGRARKPCLVRWGNDELAYAR